MKKRIPTFLAGMATMAVIGGLSVSALAASEAMTITVDPINIQVKGTTFIPKDAQGNSVPVFSYNGTTYAPLRALAEAYGLNVGYDSKNNMATVSSEAASTETPTPSPSQTPDNTASSDYSNWTAEEEAAYQEFKGLWEVRLDEGGGDAKTVNLDHKAETPDRIKRYATSNTKESVEIYCQRFANELYQKYGRGIFAYRYENEGTVIWLWADNLDNDGWRCGYSFLGYDKIIQM